MTLEEEVEILKQEVHQLRIKSRDYSQYIDVMVSPVRKRIWWWIGGYCFNKVGRWYSMNCLWFKIWYKIAKLIRLT